MPLNDGEAWFLSKIVTGMVLVLGFFVHWSLTTEQYEDLLSDYEISSSRKPASLVKISDLEGGHLPSKSVMSTIDLNCVDNFENLKIKSQTNQLRLVGRLCNETDLKNVLPEQLYISNTSNGFDATVFARQDRQFTTDYVYLKEGRNRIVISRLLTESEVIHPLKEITIEKMDRLVLDGKNSNE